MIKIMRLSDKEILAKYGKALDIMDGRLMKENKLMKTVYVIQVGNAKFLAKNGYLDYMVDNAYDDDVLKFEFNTSALLYASIIAELLNGCYKILPIRVPAETLTIQGLNKLEYY